jgi:transposase InsO family protein
VRSFLGFASYYRKFVENFATIARPLNDLLAGYENKSKKRPFVWGQQQQKAFETLIDKLCTTPVLAYANYNKPFILHTDASLNGLGAVLYQMQDDNTKRVVAYASRSLKPSEKNYHSSKLEFLALKWSVTEKFHDYLYGVSFEVLTDNNPLTYVKTTAKLDACGLRWEAALSNYDFCIKYRSGKSNIDADVLSRQPHVDTVSVGNNVIRAVLAAHVVDDTPIAATFTDTRHNQTKCQTLSTHDWAHGQNADDVISRVKSFVEGGRFPDIVDYKCQPEAVKKYLRHFKQLHISNGVLYHRTTSEEDRSYQIVLPESARQEIFRALHDDLGHQGRDRTLSLFKERFYWPGMATDVALWVSRCGRCLRSKSPPIIATGLVNIESSYPMELLCIDYLSLEVSKGGYENVLVITDHFTRYAQAFPTKNQTARTTAKVLFENFFVHYGFPEKLHSDRGQNFLSKVIQRLCKIAGVKRTRTTPYHPQGNGQCERFNQTLIKMLRTLESERKSDWKSAISALVHAYNVTKCEVTGYSPYHLMFGRTPRLAIDAVLGILGQRVGGASPSEYMRQLELHLANAYKYANRCALVNADKAKQRYDIRVQEAKLLPGDRCVLRNNGIKGKHKLSDIWSSDVYVI